ncbi:MAG TPA: CehA/McbA family metallohydrolase [bacterium]|nr:CehA/McbA family metallohydrolase [bacterium]
MYKNRKKLFALLSVLVVIFLITPWINAANQRATFQFSILDIKTGEPIPGKLTFIQDGEEIDLDIPDQKNIAPEDNGFFTATGQGKVSIPVGEYTVYASRGMEYSIDKKKIKINRAGNQFTFKIQRELDPKGYVAADFHMHTLNSDGNCTVEERITSLVGGGVEFAASADHNYVTNYSPAVKAMQVSEYLKTCPGNEVTTGSLGHFNVYPLSPNSEPSLHDSEDAHLLFGHARDVPHQVVIQINHPRMGDSYDFYGKAGIDPLTGQSDHPGFSWDFDAVEIMNEPLGWGIRTDDENYFSVWNEWFNYLNRGFDLTGVGNTDSHDLLGMPVGWPRNYIASSTDKPSEIQVEEITESILDNKVAVSQGIFTNLTINDEGKIGSEVVDKDGKIKVDIEALSPSWIKFEKIVLFANGRKVWSKDIKPASEYRKTLLLNIDKDTWYVLRAEGSKSLWPIVPEQGEFHVTPLGFTNPVWVDTDGKGFETERDRAHQFFDEYKNDISRFKKEIVKKDIWFQRQLLGIVEQGSSFELSILKSLLKSEDNFIREFTFKRLGRIKSKEALNYLKSIKDDIKVEKERTLVEAMITSNSSFKEKMPILRKATKVDDQHFQREIIRMLSTEKYQREWHIVGPFDSPDEKGLQIEYKPENRIDLATKYIGKNNTKIEWQDVDAEQDGYIDLTSFIDDYENSIGYAYANIHSDQKLKTAIIFGSDDGAAIWHNGKEIYREFVWRSANPYQEIIPITLEKGDNKFLVKVENGAVDWGFYFQLLTPANQ